MNVVLTTGTDGTVTVHRDTCKKIEGRNTRTVEEQVNLEPRRLVTAKTATCCKPSALRVEDVEQAGWDALEAATDAAANDDAPEAEFETAMEDEAEAEDLIGEVEPTKPTAKKTKTAIKVAKEIFEKKEINGAEALAKVAEYLTIDLGPKPVFPGFGRAFKTIGRQSVYINSKGSADARAASPAQADLWAELDHVERRAGNYVRVSLGNI